MHCGEKPFSSFPPKNHPNLGQDLSLNKTIKDGDIAPWKDLQKRLNKDKRKGQKKHI